MASIEEPKVACLCGIVGFDSIKQQENGEPLQEQYPKMAQKKNQTKAEKKKAKEIGRLRGKIERQYGAKAVFTTGPNGKTCTSIDELTQDLLERDCEKLFNFDGKKSAGLTAVPEIYTPMKASVVQPEREAEVLENCPDERKDKLAGEFHSSRSDLVEHEALNTVKKYYQDHPEKTALVIKGLPILKKPNSSATDGGTTTKKKHSKKNRQPNNKISAHTTRIIATTESSEINNLWGFGGENSTRVPRLRRHRLRYRCTLRKTSPQT